MSQRYLYQFDSNKKNKQTMSLPILSLNQMLLFSGLAFFSGISLTYGLLIAIF